MKLFLSALGLAMILEGIPYFLSPEKVKDLAQHLPGLANSTLRFFGLAIMMAGLVLLLLSRRWIP